MKLSEIKVNRAILMDVITDDSVYAIVKDKCWHKDKPIMKPIKEVDVEELLSEETIIVQITE